MTKHYETVADLSSVPIIIYNIPANTGIDLTADILSQLAPHPNIIGLKDSGGDVSTVRLKRGGTREENRFLLSPKRTSPFKSAGAAVQSTAGSRGVHISVSNAGYTTFRGSVRVLATHSIRQFPLHFPSRASPCAIRFQTQSTT